MNFSKMNCNKNKDISSSTGLLGWAWVSANQFVVTTLKWHDSIKSKVGEKMYDSSRCTCPMVLVAECPIPCYMPMWFAKPT